MKIVSSVTVVPKEGIRTHQEIVRYCLGSYKIISRYKKERILTLDIMDVFI